MRELLNDAQLERSEIVANNLMNRERGIVGANSYTKDLHFSPLGFLLGRLDEDREVAWLDLCCGTATALIQSAVLFAETGVAEQVSIVGIDLVPGFLKIPAEIRCLRLETATMPEWQTKAAFDLITCVHGLHYVGDKLGAIQMAVASLKPDGLFIGHLDLDNVQIRDVNKAEIPVKPLLANAGFE